MGNYRLNYRVNFKAWLPQLTFINREWQHSVITDSNKLYELLIIHCNIESFEQH